MPRLALVALTLCALLPSRAEAYELKRTAEGEPIRWTVNRVRMQLHESIETHLDPGDGYAALSVAADAWSGRAGPDLWVDLRMQRGAHDALEPGVQLVWPERWEHPPHLLAVTATSYVESTGEILDADILINPTVETALLREPSDPRYDLASIVTHEAGHVLGLAESDVPGATMWPNIGRGEQHQRALTTDDVAGLEEAYRGAVLSSATGCARAAVAPRSGSASGVALAGMLLGLALATVGRGLGRRRRALLMTVALGFVLTPLMQMPPRPAAARPSPAAFHPHPDAAVFAGPVRHTRVQRRTDGSLQTRLTVGAHRVTIAGGCLGGRCVTYGEAPPPVGRTVAVDPRTGSWTYRRTEPRTGGWMAPPPLQHR